MLGRRLAGRTLSGSGGIGTRARAGGGGPPGEPPGLYHPTDNPVTAGVQAEVLATGRLDPWGTAKAIQVRFTAASTLLFRAAMTMGTGPLNASFYAKKIGETGSPTIFNVDLGDTDPPVNIYGQLGSGGWQRISVNLSNDNAGNDWLDLALANGTTLTVDLCGFRVG